MALIPREARTFKQPIARPKTIPGPEFNPWFWHPSRAGVRMAPPSFAEKLEEFDREVDLKATWNPILERWQLWAPSPRMQHKVCQGWRLLFIHNGPSGEYLPLDERVLARLEWASARVHGSSKGYFARIQAEMERDEAMKQKRLAQEAVDQAMPYWEHSQIKNIGKGSKFSTYHA